VVVLRQCEVPFDLEGCLGDVSGFLLAVVLVEVQAECQVPNCARVGRVEPVGQIRLQEPFTFPSAVFTNRSLTTLATAFA
jgi:hypothetical protein